ncbi:hypothetical protein [Marinicella gelatinilytica]|uniref:hypothetical protein n=1 Tax=Marinicella gelatinilytica TaxID=2996017 RepID=UPI00226100F8|nr:hypothetical protein [Marinicella gelatinilytica]MCX7545206.1 hypothetical protein [Marinicella gelatinilytica]
MFKRTTVKLFLIIVFTYTVVWLPYVIWEDRLPDYLITPYAVMGLIQMAPVYILNGLGIPGLLLDHCGWGWCGATIYGYIVLATFWVVVAWLTAWLISKLINAKLGNLRTSKLNGFLSSFMTGWAHLTWLIACTKMAIEK